MDLSLIEIKDKLIPQLKILWVLMILKLLEQNIKINLGF